MCVCVSVYGYVHLKLKCSASGDQKGHQTPQKLEFLVVVSPLMWVVVTQFRASGKAANTFNH